jgi:hypothetical protein
MNAAELGAALGRRTSTRGWRAPCPAHDDRHPSLDITEAPDGRVLFICRAGCSQTEVIDALRERGLWSPPSSRLPVQGPRAPEVLPPYIGPRDSGPCCFESFDCEHWGRFNRLWLLGELHKNLVEACRELIEKLKRADQPVTPEILRQGIEFAIPFGAIALPGVDDETEAKMVDLTIAEFTRNEQAAA